MQTVSDEYAEAASAAMQIAYVVCNARCIPPQNEMDRFNELDKRWKASMFAKPKQPSDTLPNRCREEGV